MCRGILGRVLRYIITAWLVAGAGDLQVASLKVAEGPKEEGADF